jgi:hypothetical protein
MNQPLIRIENACWYDATPTDKLDDIYIRPSDVRSVYTCDREPIGCVILLDDNDSVWTLESPTVVAAKINQALGQLILD